jgi:hypothetical protein
VEVVVTEPTTWLEELSSLTEKPESAGSPFSRRPSPLRSLKTSPLMEAVGWSPKISPVTV